MSAAFLARIPPSVLHWLERVPPERPIALLLRHSVREDLPPLEVGRSVPITESGRRVASELGALLGQRLKTLRTSPLIRCVQTAEALRDGAAVTLPVETDRLLGDPGVYVVDGRRAWQNWETKGHDGVMAHLVAEAEALPGMSRPDAAARFLVKHMMSVAGEAAGVHVFVTHDSLVTATAARMLGRPLGNESWPWYLEGAFFWRDTDGLHTAYRDEERVFEGARLCHLEETDVVELARREVAATIGLDSGARFFLAGGAFKTLLTGRAPRDLDVWAPSEADRQLVISALERRGARRLDVRAFADAFAVGDRVIEVPIRVDPPTLEERLARFDIALSAVGVEHRPGDHWSAKVHPLALTSVERREVLLLKPLVNWRYALATLERLRRYAAELGYAVPPEEEAEIWRVFDAQPDDVQVGMLERYARAGTGASDIAEEASCRRR